MRIFVKIIKLIIKSQECHFVLQYLNNDYFIINLYCKRKFIVSVKIM